MRRRCESDPDLWFPRGFNRANLQQIVTAKRECGRCPALAECRSESLAMAENLPESAFRAVQAGMTPRELVAEARRVRDERRERLAAESAKRREQRAS